ncbi:polysaccharide deacetylase family protein [Clostridium sp. MD294]|uniref:polysaccharide deacetylase family protein n=1 Tax=Clostridium sp. MD294 TaxID=97138 RepID=UPI0002CADF47|nr:polysaccharide deacetylase family protein [Clostridium sp. MD294]NDO45728.1 polysaccharide deacetylase family protein [Clostridium sp. MD294]USF30618.1 hypothetical protein C820_002061 [Clostridium sp. MD294]
MGIFFSTTFPSLLLSVAIATQPTSIFETRNEINFLSSASQEEHFILVEEEQEVSDKTELIIENLDERKDFSLDRGEACRYIMDTYEILTGKKPKIISETPFSDIDADSQQFILQAYHLGIVNGNEDGTFLPSDGLSRGDFTILLYRLIQTVYPDADLSGGENIVFEEHVTKVATIPLQFAYSRGLIDIQSNGLIGSDDTITLGEVADILNNVIKTAPNFPVQYTKFAPKRAYLTFDDGTSENTPKILDILKQYNVKATFFVTGNCDEVLLKRMQSEGHVIGNHTSSHKYETLYSSSEAFWSDFNKEQEYLNNILGTTSIFMRFPGGSNNSIGMKNGVMGDITTQAKQNGYIYVDWNVDSGDARGNNVPKDTIINNVLDGTSGKSQAIILMHQTKPKQTTVEALPEIIEGLQTQGYEIRPLTEKSYTPRFVK